MSLFSWLTPAKKKSKAPAQPDSSGLSRMDSTKPYPPRGGHHEDNARPANRKHERLARRELLYGVVRECMAKAGVVSASYKFKVLSLDARGREFMVMVDLAREYGSATGGLAEIEVMVAQSAKARYDIVITAVYWRMADHVAVGVNGARAAPVSRPAPLVSQPVPLVSQPTPLEPAAGPLARQGGRFEAIQADEVAAFKKALAAGVTGSEALAAAGGANAKSFDGTPMHGPQSYTLLTGFEDTELCEEGAPPGPAGPLSATQYGELR
ncbi:MAG: hypothetical protein HY854_21155 [Burkholderiales bacterium]|nr:hypothetical protein [Burkholderiales bacterium]